MIMIISLFMIKVSPMIFKIVIMVIITILSYNTSNNNTTVILNLSVTKRGDLTRVLIDRLDYIEKVLNFITSIKYYHLTVSSSSLIYHNYLAPLSTMPISRGTHQIHILFCYTASLNILLLRLLLFYV